VRLHGGPFPVVSLRTRTSLPRYCLVVFLATKSSRRAPSSLRSERSR
jgi:hypothetical protein